MRAAATSSAGSYQTVQRCATCAPWPITRSLLNIPQGAHRTPSRSQLARHLPTAKAQKQDERTKTSQKEQDSTSESGGSNNIVTVVTRWAAEVVASPIFYLIAGLAAIKLVSSTGEQSSLILLFAALPVTALTAISKSDIGKQVAAQLEERLPELEAEASKIRASHEEARKRNKWYGPDRPKVPTWFGRVSHLTGQVAGDYAFDPLSLSKDPAAFDRNWEAELLHARWAMLGAVGVLVPEVLSMRGVELGEPVWWKVGAAKLQDDLTFNWGGIEGFRIAGKQGIGIIVLCQLVLMGGPEYARQVGIKSLEPVGVFLPGDKNYPGGAPFDPLGFSQRPDEFVDQAVKEIKHGRLAMVAMLGYAAQALVTREGPVQNLVDFIHDPARNNLFARITGSS